MLRLNRSLPVPLLLAALLIWAQLSVAQHDIEHSSHEETEICEIFLLSSDGAKAVELASNQSFLNRYYFQYSVSKNDSIVERFAPAHSARSPPFL